MGILTGIANYRAKGVGNYIQQAGKYRFLIKDMKHDEKAYGGELFAIELEVVSAEKTEKQTLVEGPNGLVPSENQEPHKVGTLLSRIDQFPASLSEDEKKTRMGGFLQCLEGITGLDSNNGEFDTAGVEELFGKDKPMVGSYVDCIVFTKPQVKKPKVPFTATKWMHVKEAPAAASTPA